MNATLAMRAILRELITAHRPFYRDDHVECYCGWRHDDGIDQEVMHADHLALAIFDTQMVTSPTDLERLPVDTVVRDAGGAVHVRETATLPFGVEDLPAVVLWLPDAAAHLAGDPS